MWGLYEWGLYECGDYMGGDYMSAGTICFFGVGDYMRGD